MARHIQWNNKVGWLATAADMPYGDVITALSAQDPITQTRKSYRFDSADHQLAWQLTSEAQRDSLRHGHDPGPLGLETYVIGPPRDRYEGRFCHLFWDRSPTTESRLIFHRQRVTPDRTAMPDLWDGRHRFEMMTREDFGPEHHQTLNGFLDELVKAEGEGSEAIKAIYDQTGHPYAHSRGFLDGDRQ